MIKYLSPKLTYMINIDTDYIVRLSMLEIIIIILFTVSTVTSKYIGLKATTPS